MELFSTVGHPSLTLVDPTWNKIRNQEHFYNFHTWFLDYWPPVIKGHFKFKKWTYHPVLRKNHKRLLNIKLDLWLSKQTDDVTNDFYLFEILNWTFRRNWWCNHFVERDVDWLNKYEAWNLAGYKSCRAGSRDKDLVIFK